MKIQKAARVAALLAGGSALLVATPVLAQRAPQGRPAQQPAQGAQQGQAQAQGQRNFNLSADERRAIAPLVEASGKADTAQRAGQTADWAAVQALLPAAQAAAKGNDALYLLNRVRLQLALARKDEVAQEQAVSALVSNPSTPAAEAQRMRNAQSALVNSRAEKAFAANDFATAERLFAQLLQASPGDERLTRNLRIVRERMGNTSGALDLLGQQIQTQEANGGRAPEDLYQRAWQVPHRAGKRAEALAGLQRLLKAYPTAKNWRTALDVVRERSVQDDQLLLDTYRFARAANVIQSREYLSLAQMLDQGGLPGEVKGILDAGVAAGAIQNSQADVARLLGTTNRRIAEDRTGLASQIQAARSAARGRQARIMGDVLYGYGRHAEAAEMYRLALSKGGEDANLLNTRLGASLAMAGQRAQAETALRAVTGQRSELASLWLAWLNRQG